jgi:hypothetical protein
MKKAVILLAFIFGGILINAQVPQGFNYQAIACDASTSNPIVSSIEIEITIQSDSLGDTVF